MSPPGSPASPLGEGLGEEEGLSLLGLSLGLVSAESDEHPARTRQMAQILVARVLFLMIAGYPPGTLSPHSFYRPLEFSLLSGLSDGVTLFSLESNGYVCETHEGKHYREARLGGAS